MDKKLALRQLVAEIFEKATDEIDREFVLRTRRLEGSVGSGILDAAIRRRLGIVCPGVYEARTYGELEDAVFGKTRPDGSRGTQESACEPAPSLPESVPGGLALGQLVCGVDIEMIENLPATDNYWDDDFYRTSFSKAEIAYCVQQDEPRMHFAARWCAKEALKKCSPGHLGSDMCELEVVVDDMGRPSMRLRTGDEIRDLDVAVSLSHTQLIAAAIVVAQRNGRRA